MICAKCRVQYVSQHKCRVIIVGSYVTETVDNSDNPWVFQVISIRKTGFGYAFYRCKHVGFESHADEFITEMTFVFKLHNIEMYTGKVFK